MSDKVNVDIPDIPALEDTLSIAPPEFVRPTLQDILAQDTTDKTLSDLQNVRDEIKLNFPEPTGIRSVDDKNLADYYDTLQQIKPDLFISDDEEKSDQLRIPDLEDIPDFPEILDLSSVQDIAPPERPSLNLSDFVDVPSLEDIPSGRPENLIDQIHLSYPEPTGIASVDEKNLEDYYDTLQQIRHDLFISDDEEEPHIDFTARTTNVLVPTDVKIESNDPADILADPNVTTIIPPIVQEPYADIKPITNITSVTNNDDDIDFPVWEEDDPLIAPTEIDQNKIILTDDGDIILTEPDNMQVEEKSFTRISEGVVALPPEENMEVTKTKSIVLKRKNPKNEIAKVEKKKK